MSEHPIPAASMGRIRAQYQQFEQLVQVVAEAMGIEGMYQIDLGRSLLVVPDAPAQLPAMPNGKAEAEAPALVD